MKKTTKAFHLTPKKESTDEKKEENISSPEKQQKGTAKLSLSGENEPKTEDEEDLYAENALELSRMSFRERRAYKKQIRNKRLSTMNAKERRNYILRYYKWHLIGVFAGVLLTCWLVRTIYIANLPTELVIAITNDGINAVAEEYIPNAFRDYYHLDTKNIIQIFTDLTIDNSDNVAIRQTTLTDYEKIIVYISSGKLDAIIGDEKTLNYYKSTGDIAILDSCLDSDLYDTLSDYIINVTDESGYMNEGRPYAAAIDISGTDFVKNCNLSYNKVYLMIPNNRYSDNSGTLHLIRLIFDLPE